MQYPVIDLITSAYINNGWTGLDIPNTITYEPIQLGSGNPTPTNVRPILPASTLNIGGSDIPIYNGILNTINKTLTLYYGYVVLNGTQPIQNNGHTENTTRAFINISGKKPGRSNFMSDKFSFVVSDNVGNASGRPASDGMEFFIPPYVPDTVPGVTQWFIDNNTQLVYELDNPITYVLTDEELINGIGLKDNVSHLLKLPLPHYFPHPVIDALQRAADGTQTADDTEVLRHYLTPLGIGGI